MARKIPDHCPITQLGRFGPARQRSALCWETVWEMDGVAGFPFFFFSFFSLGDKVLIESLKACLSVLTSLVLLPILIPMASSELEPRPGTARTASDDDPPSQPATPHTPHQRFQLPNVVAGFSPGLRSGPQGGFFTGDASEQSSIAEVNRPGTGFSSTTPSVFTRDSFMSPPVRPTTGYQSIHALRPPPKSTKPSTMLTGEIDKPWKSKNNSQMRIAYWITYAAAALGIIAGALRCYFGWQGVPRLGNLCQVMEEEFETLNKDIWSHDIDLGGFGYVIFLLLNILSSVHQLIALRQER